MRKRFRKVGFPEALFDRVLKAAACWPKLGLRPRLLFPAIRLLFNCFFTSRRFRSLRVLLKPCPFSGGHTGWEHPQVSDPGDSVHHFVVRPALPEVAVDLRSSLFSV